MDKYQRRRHPTTYEKQKRENTQVAMCLERKREKRTKSNTHTQKKKGGEITTTIARQTGAGRKIESTTRRSRSWIDDDGFGCFLFFIATSWRHTAERQEERRKDNHPNQNQNQTKKQVI